MATATTTPTPTNPTLPFSADASTDVIRRGIKRTLPCKITDAEFMQIAKQRVDKEALLEQLENDFAKLKGKHNAQVDELEGEIDKARRELHTGEQDRTVLCVEVFRRASDGTGWVDTIRVDTAAVIEQRPATPVESQRYLPGVEGVPVGSNGPLLDQATAAQGAKVTVTHNGEPAEVLPPEDDDEDSDEPEDDGLAELTPAQKAAKESAAARKARRNGGKGKAK